MLAPITAAFWGLGFGAHTRTIQARHVVRGLMSETSLVGLGLGF